MILLLRPLVRLISVLWLLALGLVALGVAVYCLDGLISLGSARPDRLIGLVSVRRHVGDFLGQLAAPGSVAWLSLLCGVGAILVGLALLIGIFRRPRERLALLESDPRAGTLAARQGTLRDMIRALVEQTRGATSVKRPRVSPARRGTGGRVTVQVSRSRTIDGQELQRTVGEALGPITEPFELRSRVRVRLGERGDRVQ